MYISPKTGRIKSYSSQDWSIFQVAYLLQYLLLRIWGVLKASLGLLLQGTEDMAFL